MPSSIQKASLPWSGLHHVVLLLCYYTAVVSLVVYRQNWTPEVQPKTVPAAVFSEERARIHVTALDKGIGDRQVSTPGLAEATAYLLRQAHAIQEIAKSRTDIVVEVRKETVAGAVGMTFTDINFTNAYRGLDCVVFTITPVDPKAAATKGLLIISHHDSAVCSTGAADDASQVGIMLEAARVIVSRDSAPVGPLVFLWTGGEEPISPAAHGWQSSSDIYPTLGAFINLEAMGGGGLPIVFQHTGAWTLEAWAKGAPYPLGCRVAQDVFDLGIIPADSDYRMFSARHYGHLPGVDVAFIVDSSAYHTYSDTTERIRAGVMQEMGENLLGGISMFTSYLAEHPIEAADPAEVQERAVYFDVLGYFMVSYRDTLAQTLHLVPLAVAVSLPVLAPTSYSPGLGHAYLALFAAALRSLLSIVLAVATPVLFGAARTMLTGVPMCWFASHWVGHATLIPISTVGALLPYLGLPEEAAKHSPTNHGAYISSQVQGVAVTCGLIAWGLTAAGMTGNALVFCMSSALAAFVCVMVASPHLTPLGLIAILVASFIPTTLGSSIIAVFVEVIMERMALSGHVSVILADVVVGVLCGAAVLAVTCGSMLPIIAYSLKGQQKPVISILLLTSLGISAYVSLASLPAYTAYRPKRIILSHLHNTEPQSLSGGEPSHLLPMFVSSTRLSVSIVDSSPLSVVMDNLGPEPPASSSGFEGPDPSVILPRHNQDFSPIFPIDSMLDGYAIKAPQSATPLIKNLPFLRLASEEVNSTAQVRRLHLELFNEKPSWGVINITGPLLAWSFTDRLHPSYIGNNQVNGRQHVVRFTTQVADPLWPFWLDVSTLDAGVGMHIEVLVSYLDRTDVVDAFVKRMPDWVTESWYSTTYISEWDF